MQEQLQHIKTRLQQLVYQHQALQTAHEKMQKKQAATEAENQLLKDKISGMENTMNMLKLRAGEGDEEAKKKLEKQISKYIKEIDRCLMLLGE
jgi:hemerythrin-like domain-containing protein